MSNRKRFAMCQSVSIALLATSPCGVSAAALRQPRSRSLGSSS